METPPLYDLAPLARLMLLGAAIALAPLAWVHWRSRHHAPHDAPGQRWQALALFGYATGLGAARRNLGLQGIGGGAAVVDHLGQR